MSGIDRKQTLRIDCNNCHGNGYIRAGGGEESCVVCEGRGVIEKEVPYKFETNGKWDREELADVFEIDPSDVSDKGHDVPKDERDSKMPNIEE